MPLLRNVVAQLGVVGYSVSRISPVVMALIHWCGLRLGGCGEGEGEAGAAVESPGGGDVAGVAVDHALDGCQSEAGASEFALGVQAVEGAEQPIRVRGVEPGRLASSTWPKASARPISTLMALRGLRERTIAAGREPDQRHNHHMIPPLPCH